MNPRIASLVLADSHTADSFVDWVWVALEFVFAAALLALVVGGIALVVRAGRSRVDGPRTDS